MTTVDRDPMRLDEIDESLRASLGRVPRMNLENGLVLRVMALASGLAPGADVDGVTRRVVKQDGVGLRIYTPYTSTGAGLLWIHGGGMVLGSAKVDDRLCGETALRIGATVVSVEYRLAPRHPFPAAHEDAYAAWQWLQTHAAELGIDPARIAVGGQSAGGGIAASLVQRLTDDGAHVAAQWLLCPMLDDRTAADRALDARRHLVWDNRSNLVGWSSYLGVEPGAASVSAYAAPARRDDLAGLPPTWIYWSDIELFAAEDASYAKRLAAAGVDVTVDRVANAPHGFEAWAYDAAPAQALLGRARAWLGERLA